MSEQENIYKSSIYTSKKSKKSTNVPSAKKEVYNMSVLQAKFDSGMLSRTDVMQLQGSIGNKATMQLLKNYIDTNSLQKKEDKNSINKVDNLKNKVVQKKKNNTGIPDNLKAGIENISGIDMSDVRVRYNSDKPAQVGALAYTQGVDIHVAPGQEKYLPHEAWHVIQQAQGRVRPTMQIKGITINDDKELEKEAYEMGKKATSTSTITENEKSLLDVEKIPAELIQRVPIPQTNGTYIDSDYPAIIMRCVGGTTSGSLLLKPEGMHMRVDITLLWDGKKYSIQGMSFKSEDLITVINGGPPYPPPPGTGAVAIGKPVVSKLYLKELVPKCNVQNWSKGHTELACAHHKLGKGPMAWMFEHMTSKDQSKLKSALHLLPQTKAKALTRLTSNLISPKTDVEGEIASSDKRTDDPMNNFQACPQGMEYLDLLLREDGSLTPRSEIFFQLANETLFEINNRYISFRLQHPKEEFYLTDEEAERVISALRKAEALQYKIEGDLENPSHSKESVWKRDGNGRFAKAKVHIPNVELSSEDYEVYDKMASQQLERKMEELKAAKAAKKTSFKDWFSCVDAENEDIYDALDQYEEWLSKQEEEDDS